MPDDGFVAKISLAKNVRRECRSYIPGVVRKHGMAIAGIVVVFPVAARGPLPGRVRGRHLYKVVHPASAHWVLVITKEI